MKIGELTNETIELLNLNRKPCNIVIWDDRIKHIEKHIKDFKDYNTFKLCMEQIPSILNTPDYIGVHPDGKSIQYIKKVDKLTLVGIRLKNEGELCFRSAYPITQSQLNNYILTNRVVNLKVDI